MRDLTKARAARQLPGEQRRAPSVEIRLAGKPQVERLERLGGTEKQAGSVGPAALGEGRLGPQEVEAGALEVVQRPGLCRRQQSARRVEGSCTQASLGGRESSVGSPSGVGGQGERALQEGGRGGEASASLRPTRRALELHGDVLVRPRRRRRQMPCVSIRIDVSIRRLRQRQVRCPALGRPRGLVHRRTYQRVAEGDALSEFE